MSTTRRSERQSPAVDAGSSDNGPVRRVELNLSELSGDERSQIAARLRLSPSERLRYLEDMIAFEELARHARRVT